MEAERWREIGTSRYVATYFDSYSSGRLFARFIDSSGTVAELPIDAFKVLFERVLDDGTVLRDTASEKGER